MQSRIEAAMDIFSSTGRFHLRLFIEGILTGVLTGVVIAAFRASLEKVSSWREMLYAGVWGQSPLLVTGCILLLLSLAAVIGFLVRRVPMCSGSGIPQLKGILLGRMSMCWYKVLVSKFLGGVLGIGAGMSLGREGPSVQLGACVAQALGSKRSELEQRFLLAAGGGAGLAAAFNAPLAGIVFCLEELVRHVSAQVLMSAMAAAVSAAAVVQLFFGSSPIFHIGELPVLPLAEYGWLLLLGSGLGFLALGFNKTLLLSLDIYDRLGWPVTVRIALPLFGAALLGFFLPQILGGGNALVDSLVSEEYLLSFLVILFVGKFLFTMLCFGSGAPGGIFLPMLVLGALGGAAGSHFFLFLGADSSYAVNFIVLGMAAYFAAVVKSPVTGSILIMEMTGSFQHILSLSCVSMAAFLTADILGGGPVYEQLLARSLSRSQPQQCLRQHHSMSQLLVCTGSKLAHAMIRDMELPPHSLIVSVRRGTDFFVPDGSTRILPGDWLYILGSAEDREKLRYLAAEPDRDASAIS